jgi:UDP-glucose:glycoprotein glucosyltransferase
MMRPFAVLLLGICIVAALSSSIDTRLYAQWQETPWDAEAFEYFRVTDGVASAWDFMLEGPRSACQGIDRYKRDCFNALVALEPLMQLPLSSRLYSPAVETVRSVNRQLLSGEEMTMDIVLGVYDNGRLCTTRDCSTADAFRPVNPVAWKHVQVLLQAIPQPEHAFFRANSTTSKRAILWLAPSSTAVSTDVIRNLMASLNVASLQWIMHTPLLSGREAVNRPPLALDGYSVELQIKNTEYIAVDDSDTAAADPATADATDGVERVEGAEPPAKMKPNLPVKSHKKLEFQFLATLHNNLSTFVDVTSRLPSVAGYLSRRPMPSALKRSVGKIRRLLGPLSLPYSGTFQPDDRLNAIYLNGRRLTMDQATGGLHFHAFLPALREDQAVLSRLGGHLQWPEALQPLLLQNFPSAFSPSAISARYLCLSEEHIFYLNDLEVEARYRNWPRSISTLLRQSYPGQLAFISRNLVQVVFYESLSEKAALSRWEHLQYMLEQNAPLRMGLLPKISNRVDRLMLMGLQKFVAAADWKAASAALRLLLDRLEQEDISQVTEPMAMEVLGTVARQLGVSWYESLEGALNALERQGKTVVEDYRRMGLLDESLLQQPVAFVNGRARPYQEHHPLDRVVMSMISPEMDFLRQHAVSGALSDQDKRDTQTILQELYRCQPSLVEVLAPKNFVALTMDAPERKALLSPQLPCTTPKRDSTHLLIQPKTVLVARKWDLHLALVMATFLQSSEIQRPPQIPLGEYVAFEHGPDYVEEGAMQLCVLLTDPAPGDLSHVWDALGEAVPLEETDPPAELQHLRQWGRGHLEREGHCIGMIHHTLWRGMTTEQVPLITLDHCLRLTLFHRELYERHIAEVAVQRADWSVLTPSAQVNLLWETVVLLGRVSPRGTQRGTAGMETPAGMHDDEWQSLLSRCQLKGESQPPSATLGQSKDDNHGDAKSDNAFPFPPMFVEAMVEPFSPEARLVAQLLSKLQTLFPLRYSLLFLPSPLEQSPVHSYYQLVWNPQPQWDEEGFLQPPHAAMENVDPSYLYTLSLSAPDRWLLSTSRANADLDNIKVDHGAGSSQEVSAIYELTSIVVEGNCEDARTGEPPRGLELSLIDSDPTAGAVDTLVMANLGYFQLKARPGVFGLRIAPHSLSEELYEMTPSDDSNSHSSVDGETGKSDILVLNDFRGLFTKVSVRKRPGKEHLQLLKALDSDEHEKEGKDGSMWSSFSSLFRENKAASQDNASPETVHVFSIASGHLYERFLRIMMLSVRKNTKNPLKFWFLGSYLSPKFKSSLPHLSQQWNFSYELVSYKWPTWLHAQTEKQRIIWAYKILFLDVLFPLSVKRVIFVDADQVVRADLKELVEMDLQGRPLAYTPFCDSRKEMDGFRFWKSGYWHDHLKGKPYHISALYVIDLHRYRQVAAGDAFRYQYAMLSRDPNSLSNLDQDLPNFAQHQVPIFALPQEWLWCETWCSESSKSQAKTIDLCNNPQTKEPKLDAARRIIGEWTTLDEEARQDMTAAEQKVLVATDGWTQQA